VPEGPGRHELTKTFTFRGAAFHLRAEVPTSEGLTAFEVVGEEAGFGARLRERRCRHHPCRAERQYRIAAPHASTVAYSSIGGQVQMRLRSPYALSTRLTPGQYFQSRFTATGKAACSRV